MSARLLEGRPVAAAIEDEVRRRAAGFREAAGRPPFLAVVLVGEDPASAVYVRNKTRACAEAGVGSATHRMPASSTTREVLERVRALGEDDGVDAILVQLPLPAGCDTRAVLEALPPGKDADGFHPQNAGALVLGEARIAPCTPAGILEALRFYGIPLEGRRAVVVGRSTIVGRPLALLLLHANATVTVCHSRTRDLAAVCREGELLFAAIGKPALISADHVREGAVVVDVGMNRITDPGLVRRLWGGTPREETFREKGALLVGDVDFREAEKKASAITPVPGGVGPLTIAMLLRNTLALAEARRDGGRA